MSSCLKTKRLLKIFFALIWVVPPVLAQSSGTDIPSTSPFAGLTIDKGETNKERKKERNKQTNKQTVAAHLIERRLEL
ncbi:MAG: hypothetical protein U0103_15195 [Candidatus Obscuribacterales bacterium]|nr:hypothetical protein [Cyanobacteria bacterium SZAS LIN-5]